MNFLKFYMFLVPALAVSAACGGGQASRSDAAAAEKTPPTAVSTPFDADSAYSYVAAQTAFGPRVPGSQAHRLCGDYIAGKLRQAGLAVSFQDTVIIDGNGARRPVRNIIGSFRPSAPTTVLLAAHYDSRPNADQDPDPANHSKPIDGANDGASGVAVILELARHLSSLPENVGVEVAILDQEDNGDYAGDDELWCIGSQAWAQMARNRATLPAMGILLDMVGGRDAVFNPELFSKTYAPALVTHVWSTAAKNGYAHRFPTKIGGALNDDHLYIMRAGVPCIDIVESANPATGSFNPTWHTLDDTLENIDPATLKAVGDVVLLSLKTIN